MSRERQKGLSPIAAVVAQRNAGVSKETGVSGIVDVATRKADMKRLSSAVFAEMQRIVPPGRTRVSRGEERLATESMPIAEVLSDAVQALGGTRIDGSPQGAELVATTGWNWYNPELNPDLPPRNVVEASIKGVFLAYTKLMRADTAFSQDVPMYEVSAYGVMFVASNIEAKDDVMGNLSVWHGPVGTATFRPGYDYKRSKKKRNARLSKMEHALMKQRGAGKPSFVDQAVSLDLSSPPKGFLTVLEQGLADFGARHYTPPKR